jgi:hypothetical protein
MAVLASVALLALGVGLPAPGGEERLRAAMLRLYVHGVTDRLAEQVVREEDLPHLRRLLADPAFPRRDNVVAFLAHRDGDEAVDPLLALLRDPPAPLLVPEEERALLLVPRALGQLARRGSVRARAALLGISTEVLASAASRSPDPQRFLSDLQEGALQGLALADDSEPSAVPATERAAPAVLDSHALSHDAPLTWANHPAVLHPMTEAQLAAVLREASVRVGRRDYPDDVACCVTVSPSGTAQTFGSSSDGLDVVDTQEEQWAVQSHSAARVKVVRLINYCGGPASNAAGCAAIAGFGILVVRLSANEGGLWMHEWGHNAGLHHVDDDRGVMYGAILTADLLDQRECDAFHAPFPSAGMTPVVTDICSDADDDGIAGGADNCSTAVNPEQSDEDLDGLGDACDGCPGAPAPPAPVASMPPDGAVDVSGTPRLSWAQVEGAESYEVLVSTGSGAARVVTSATMAVSEWAVSPALDAGTPYHWQVRVTTACGASGWGPVATFVTCRLAVPALLSPASQSTTAVVGLLLDWSSVSGADEYRIQIATEPGFLQAVEQSTGTASSFRPALSPGTTYYWRTRARGVCGEGAWSATRSFTTCTTAATEPVGPEDGSMLATRTPVLDWEDVPGAGNYTVEIALDEAFTEILRRAPTWESWWAVEPPLRGGPAPYYWRVAAESACGRGGGPAFRFRVCPPRPQGPVWLDVPPLPAGGLVEPAVVYDPVRRRTLVLGDPVLAYDAQTATWSTLPTSGQPASPRVGAQAIYDPLRDRVLVFGGRASASDGAPFNDTHALTLSGTPAWSALPGTGDEPRFTEGFTWAVYDSARERLLAGVFESRTYHALDLATSVWTRHATDHEIQPQHPIRRGGSMVYDAHNDRLVCFGGLWDAGGTRSFTASASQMRLSQPFPDWEPLETEGVVPSSRAHQAAVYDAKGQRLLVHGGWSGWVYGDASQLDDVQQLTLPPSGTPVWTALSAVGAAGGRMGHGAVATPEGMLVIGGAGPRTDVLELREESSRAPWRPCFPRARRALR